MISAPPVFPRPLTLAVAWTPHRPICACVSLLETLWPWALPDVGTEQAQSAGRGGRDAAGSLPSFLALWGALSSCVLGSCFSELSLC